MKWLWLAIAGALGLWLIVLLMLSGSGGRTEEKAKTPFDSVDRKAKGFDTPAAAAFSNSKRPPMRSAKPSAPLLVAPDQGKRE